MDAAPTPPSPARRPSAFLAGVLGWCVPGLGHAYLGRAGKGAFYFAIILSTYALGLWLAEWRCVSYERDPFWFAAQAVAAGPTAVTAWLTRGLEVEHRIPGYDVGLLYVSVASLLNAVAVADALGIAEEALVAADAHEAREATRAVPVLSAGPAGDALPREDAAAAPPEASVPAAGAEDPAVPPPAEPAPVPPRDASPDAPHAASGDAPGPPEVPAP